MPFTLNMPKLSPTMEEGTITTWFKKEGDFIEAGDLLMEVATDKAQVEYNAIDEGFLRKILIPSGKEALVNELKDSNKKSKIEIQRFKGLGEMNPSQLRETTMKPGSRRLVQLTMEPGDKTNKVMDMLLSKKRAPDRKKWIEDKGNLANV